MKKLIIAAMALAMAAGVNAQEKAGGAGTIGGVATSTIAAGAVGLGVAAAVISNNRGTTVRPGPNNPTCPTGYTLTGDVCTATTVTASGTGTTTVVVTTTPIAG